MKSLNDIESWESVSKRVYWDRDVTLEKWRDMVARGHRSYLPDAVANMDVIEFIHFYGAKPFVEDWPSLRESLPANPKPRIGTYDMAWSRLVGAGWNLKPRKDFFAMPKRRRQFLLHAVRRPGLSIYELAKDLGLQYRRAHDHARILINEGALRDVVSIEAGRRKRKLYPSCF